MQKQLLFKEYDDDSVWSMNKIIPEIRNIIKKQINSRQDRATLRDACQTANVTPQAIFSVINNFCRRFVEAEQGSVDEEEDKDYMARLIEETSEKKDEDWGITRMCKLDSKQVDEDNRRHVDKLEDDLFEFKETLLSLPQCKLWETS
ncbi:hypothetical protein Aduo_018586 [Ancylostoma duodenale]